MTVFFIKPSFVVWNSVSLSICEVAVLPKTNLSLIQTSIFLHFFTKMGLLKLKMFVENGLGQSKINWIYSVVSCKYGRMLVKQMSTVNVGYYKL